MADKKISQLTALSAANLAPSTDVLAIVDTSATETKKIAAQDIVNGVLNVASAVGIGTSSPSQKLSVLVADASQAASFQAATGRARVRPYADATSGAIIDATNAAENAYLPLTLQGSTLRLLGGGGSGAVLDTSGNLGLGVTPAAGVKFDVRNDSTTTLADMRNANASGYGIYIAAGSSSSQYVQRWADYNNNALATLDASGRLGIGTTSPNARLNVVGGTGEVARLESSPVDAANDNGPALAFQITQANAQSAQLALIKAGSTGNWDGYLAFSTKPGNATPNNTTTERGRFTAGGYFKANPSGTYIGSTSDYHEFSGDSASQYIFRVFNDGNNANRLGMVIQCGADNAAGTNYALVFDDGDGTRQGEITFSGGTTTYGTSSDYRLKDNIRPIDNAISRLAQLKPCKWDWKRNGQESEGFVAHELQEVVPIAVAGEKDAVDENGSPIYQSVGAANVVPLLTAALQEAMARIESLEADVAALKGAK